MKKVLKNQTFQYLDNIWLEIISECEACSSCRKLSVKKRVFPPNLCSNFVRLEKDVAVKEHSSRFRKK